ncbi:acyltransferase family protein [Akkermansia glycaniphila]|uniref:acyltransferase family protein n=1 Tax=Akkermansia glycaniphila TaxID=1679444 RepID=UPI001C0316FC|nr:acyltransferase family protein [Akkermansia glycaniphila]MBT9449891.1 acyltransferase family protein [Akkermansia glycaniphila]
MEPLSAVSKNRIPWIDLARVLAMYFVILSHTQGSAPWCALPTQGGVMLFFFLAGYFSPRNAGKSWNRVMWLGISWTAWAVIAGCLAYATATLYPNDPQATAWKDHLSAIWIIRNAFGLGEHPFLVVLWFLCNLFVYQLIYAACRIYRWKARHIYALVLLLVILWGATNYSIPYIHQAGILCFLSGAGMRSIKPGDLAQAMRKRLWILLPLVILAWSAFFFHGQSYLFEAPWTWLMFPLLAGGGLALLLLALFLFPLGGKITSYLAHMGPALMWIYGAHIPLYRVLKAALRAIAGHPVELNAAAALISFFILYYLYLLFQKLFPLPMSILCLGARTKPFRATQHQG